MYVAVNSADFKRLTEGEAEASDIEELERMLIEHGLLLVDARPAKKWRIFKHAISMNDNERAEFLESVGEMLEAGIPISEALEEMCECEKGKTGPSAKSARRFFDAVARGEPLSACAGQETGAIDPISLGLIRAGEASGDLSGALLTASGILKRRADVKSKLLRALIGPMLTSLAALSALGVWVIYLVPRFIDFLVDAGVQIPTHIKFLGEIALFFSLHGLSVLGFGSGALVLLALLWRIETAKRVASRQFGRLLPIYKMNESLKFLAAIGGLYRAGIPLTGAMALYAGIAVDSSVKNALDRANTGLHSGRGLSDVLDESGLLPGATLRIVRTGEKSDTLGAAFSRAETLLSKSLQKRIDSLVGSLPQVLILIMGGMFVAMVCGVVLPIYEAVSTIR